MKTLTTKTFLALSPLLLCAPACGGGSGGAGPQTAYPGSADGGDVADAATTEAEGPCTPTQAGAANDCTSPLAPGADRKCTIEIAGVAREVLIYAPPGYDSCKPAVLVVDAHGASETDTEHAGKEPFKDWPGGLGSGWRLLADREGFVVAQPQGLGNVWNEPDADFMLQIPALVAKTAKIDPKRVYMTGISNGGELSYWTGCKDTDVFRAFAPISGFGQMACPLTHPAPLIHFHSPDDKIIPLANGESAFQTWVKSNHCKDGPTPSWQFGGPKSDPREVCVRSTGGATPTWKLAACDAAAPATTCQTWSQCDGGVEATFCTVPPDKKNHYDTTGGHVLYINATNLSLAAVAWEHFKKFQ